MKKLPRVARSPRSAKPLISGRPLEALEKRTLLSAASVATIGNSSVASGAAATTLDLNADFTDPAVSGTTVLMQTNNGDVPVELFDNTSFVPQTTTNFLNYVNSGRYNGTIIHRSEHNFVIQGGGYDASGNAIATDAAIPLEYHFANTRGTISMARGASLTSATSQWFINTVDNTTTLGQSNNGGYSVFGQVIYNGMAVVDTISNLPTIPASTLNAGTLPSSFPLPVQSAAGGTAASNLVVESAVRVVPHLTYSVSSDNPSIVNPTLGSDGHTLSLVYGAAGTAHLTVTATDLGSGTSTQTFSVGVGVATSPDTTPVGIGIGGVKLVTYKQANGTTVKVSLKGAGAAVVNFVGSNVPTTTGKGGTVVSGTASASSITVTGANATTVLNVTGTGGAKLGTLGDVTADGPLGGINAKNSDLVGNVTVAGSLRTLTVHGASGGDVVIGAGAQPLVFKSATAVADESITSGSGIASITAPGWSAATAGGSTLTAPTFGNIAIKGALTNTVITPTGAGMDLNKLAVGGAITGTTVNATGNIGTVSASSLVSSTIFAGVQPLTGQALPNFPTDFATAAAITAVKLKAAKSGDSFVNSNVAAQSLGTMSLGRIGFGNNGTTFGLAAHTIATFSGQDTSTGKKFSVKKITDNSQVATQLGKLGITSQGDFVVKIF